MAINTRMPRVIRKYDLRRSNRWPSVRKAHLKLEPICQACGTTDKLEVHHLRPFHLHPELELEQSNLITLCEKRAHDCHFRIGHFLNWQWINPDAVAEALRFKTGREEARLAAAANSYRINQNSLRNRLLRRFWN